MMSYVMPGAFVSESSRQVDSDEGYRQAGWWAFQGFDLERVCLRTRADNNDLWLVIAREDGRVVAVLAEVRPGAKEWGWVQ